jgi:hypothetical protein
MTKSVCDDNSPRASVSKRELRALAKRLAPSEQPELRAVARALDKAAAREAYSRAHHDGGDFDPFRCGACLPDLWVGYVIGVAFPNADEQDLDLQLAALQGLTGENLALALDAGRDERCAPDVTHAWLALRDRQCDELDTLRAELQPGCWYRDDCGRWVRDFDEPDPGPDPEIDALLAAADACHSAEADAFIAAHSRYRRLVADPALIQEIRFGSDPRKARTAKRASLRKGFDSSWLI